MTLTFNSRHLPRSLTEWDQLVTACGVRDDTIETHWLERKGAGLKLSTAEGKFTLAKAILAFANRDPETAQPYLDGHALILIGIENTGEITGVPRIEDHQLLNGLKAFLGQGDSAPRWTTHRVRVDDENDVLIINVDAPRAGDPLFTLPQGQRELPRRVHFRSTQHRICRSRLPRDLPTVTPAAGGRPPEPRRGTHAQP